MFLCLETFLLKLPKCNEFECYFFKTSGARSKSYGLEPKKAFPEK